MTRFADILFNLMALFIAIYLGVDIFYRFMDAQLLTINASETAAGTFPRRTMEKQPPPAHYDKISQRGLIGGPTVSREEKTEEMGEEQIAALLLFRRNLWLTIAHP